MGESTCVCVVNMSYRFFTLLHHRVPSPVGAAGAETVAVALTEGVLPVSKTDNGNVILSVHIAPLGGRDFVRLEFRRTQLDVSGWSCRRREINMRSLMLNCTCSFSAFIARGMYKESEGCRTTIGETISGHMEPLTGLLDLARLITHLCKDVCTDILALPGRKWREVF